MSNHMPIAQFRTHLQDNRIDQGRTSGELTRKEAHGLRSEHREIKAAIREAKSDGTVTAEERKEIRGMQNAQSKDIFEAKHDGDKRGTPRADKREDRQQGRIKDGVQDGSVTKAEAFGLRSMQGAVNRAEARFKSDGEVSPQERARLEQLQDMASKQIYTAKHNGAKRA